jgi:hypothetical protein
VHKCTHHSVQVVRTPPSVTTVGIESCQTDTKEPLPSPSSTGARELVEVATVITCGLGGKATHAVRLFTLFGQYPIPLEISFNHASESRVEGLTANGWAGNRKDFFGSC